MKLKPIFAAAVAVTMLSACGVAPADYSDIKADKMTIAMKNSMDQTGQEYQVTTVESGLIKAMASVTATAQEVTVVFEDNGKIVGSFRCMNDESPIVKILNAKRDNVPQTNSAICMK